MHYNKNLIRNKILTNLKQINATIADLELKLDHLLAEDSQMEDFDYKILKPYYQSLGKLKEKRKKIEQLLETGNYGIVKKVTPAYELVLIDYVKDHIVNFDNRVLCGKNAIANDTIFNITRDLRWTYYHAKVIGGGLIAMKNEHDVLGNTLACLYSKYFKKTGFWQGSSWKTYRIAKGTKKGSFLFLDHLEVKDYQVLTFLFYKDPEAKKIYVGVQNLTNPQVLARLEQSKKPKLFYLTPSTNTKRYDSILKHYEDLKLNNLHDLDKLIPECYDLR